MAIVPILNLFAATICAIPTIITPRIPTMAPPLMHELHLNPVMPSTPNSMTHSSPFHSARSLGYERPVPVGSPSSGGASTAFSDAHSNLLPDGSPSSPAVAAQDNSIIAPPMRANSLSLDGSMPELTGPALPRSQSFGDIPAFPFPPRQNDVPESGSVGGHAPVNPSDTLLVAPAARSNILPSEGAQARQPDIDEPWSIGAAGHNPNEIADARARLIAESGDASIYSAGRHPRLTSALATGGTPERAGERFTLSPSPETAVLSRRNTGFKSFTKVEKAGIGALTVGIAGGAGLITGFSVDAIMKKQARDKHNDAVRKWEAEQAAISSPTTPHSKEPLAIN